MDDSGIIVSIKLPANRLEWYQSSLGPASQYKAKDICKELGNGWRLPTIQELLLTFHSGRRSKKFLSLGMLQSLHWSVSSSSSFAWCVNFRNGEVRLDSKSYHRFFRPVRCTSKGGA